MKISTIILLILDALIILGLVNVVINQIRQGDLSDRFGWPSGNYRIWVLWAVFV